MPVTKERFAQGLTYDAYKAQMTRNRERFEANEQTVELNADDLAFFAQLPQPLNVLVLAEDWCGDVIANLPVLGRLAAESGKLTLRVFLRDQNLDLMDQYLKNGQFRSIPTFVFFDAEFHELGHWIERPAQLTELRSQMRRDLFAQDPALANFTPDTPVAQLPEDARMRVMEATNAFREEHRSFSDREVVREIRAIAEHGLKPAAAIDRQEALGTAPQTGATVRRAKHPIKVSITYCASCGYEPQTLALASALMHEFLHDLASIELIPWQDGAFEVVVDGDLVHSMYRDGGFPEHETIIRAVRERLAA
ncbi:MAG TPA: SelT/SelW/SelH family protein [Roseiflexaceae bacterium]|jgi:selT/selW/selH-like putative selenoprotein